MPVPNGSEKVIKIHRDSNYNPTWPPQQQSANQQQEQQESRTWSTQTVTKRVVSSNSTAEPIVTQQTTSSKSSDLFSNAHDRRGSSPVSPTPGGLNSTNRNNTTTSMRFSSLVRNALNGFEDPGFGRDTAVSSPTFNQSRDQNQQSSSTRRNSKTTTFSSQQQTIPSSTPTMEIVPSSGGQMSPTWSMGTDAGGDVPVTYEIVTKADGKKEFQLLLTAKQFSPEDLEVKLTDNKLYISGKHEERSPNGAYSQKSFYRSCTIPSGVRPEDLNCSLDSCGRLKISAPVPDEDKQMHSSTKTITTMQRHNDWHKDGILPGATKIGPGAKEQVITVWNQNDNNTGGNTSGGIKEQREERTTKTVTRTYKTLA